MKFVTLFCAGLFFSAVSKAQSFAINTDGSTAKNSAIMDVKSNSKGMLVPQLFPDGNLMKEHNMD